MARSTKETSSPQSPSTSLFTPLNIFSLVIILTVLIGGAVSFFSEISQDDSSETTALQTDDKGTNIQKSPPDNQITDSERDSSLSLSPGSAAESESVLSENSEVIDTSATAIATIPACGVSIEHTKNDGTDYQVKLVRNQQGEVVYALFEGEKDILNVYCIQATINFENFINIAKDASGVNSITDSDIAQKYLQNGQYTDAVGSGENPGVVIVRTENKYIRVIGNSSSGFDKIVSINIE